jgi:hypothetical protein
VPESAEFMLSLKKLTRKEIKPEQFLALNIGDEAVRAAVWTVSEGKTQIVNLGKAEIWDGKDQEALLKAADQTLSQASEGSKPEPNSVILGLPDSWIDKDAIVDEKKTLIKYLCTELDLKPLGFVTTDSAIAAYLKIEEGTPLSAVLIQLNSGEINLSVVKLGKTIGTQLVGRSGDLGADVEEGLSRFTQVDSLPARMILYNGKTDFEEDKQQLLSYDWEDKLPFIHFPKVESLGSDATIKAVALAGGSEVAQALGIEIKEKETKKEAEPKNAASLGFVAGKDAAEDEKPAEKETKTVEAVNIEPVEKLETEEPEPKSGPRKIEIIENIKEKLSEFSWPKIPSFSLPRGKWPIFAGGGFVALLIVLFLAYWYLPKADVVLSLEPQEVNQDIELTLDPQASQVNAADSVLPVKLVDKSVSGEKATETSGTKTIGDPATGTITIYNKTESSKTFVKGTVLLGPDQLAFTLDEEVTVASRSAEEDSEGVITITPGKIDTKLTAANIGPESNLGGDTRLSFKQFSEDDYYAKTSGGLSGGTAREVKAVADEDMEKLERELHDDLIAKARAELGQNLGADEVLIEFNQDNELDDKEFSNDSDEAADNLTLKASLAYEGAIYRQPEMDMLLQEAIKAQVPENFMVSGFSNLELGDAEPGDGDQWRLPIDYQATFLPRLDLNAIKQQLKGKTPQRVESYLTSLPQFVKADINLIPALPAPLNTLPRITKNIRLEIEEAQ